MACVYVAQYAAYAVVAQPEQAPRGIMRFYARYGSRGAVPAEAKRRASRAAHRPAQAAQQEFMQALRHAQVAGAGAAVVAQVRRFRRRKRRYTPEVCSGVDSVLMRCPSSRRGGAGGESSQVVRAVALCQQPVARRRSVRPSARRTMQAV